LQALPSGVAVWIEDIGQLVDAVVNKVRVTAVDIDDVSEVAVPVVVFKRHDAIWRHVRIGDGSDVRTGPPIDSFRPSLSVMLVSGYYRCIHKSSDSRCDPSR